MGGTGGRCSTKRRKRLAKCGDATQGLWNGKTKGRGQLGRLFRNPRCSGKRRVQFLTKARKISRLKVQHRHPGDRVIRRLAHSGKGRDEAGDPRPRISAHV